MSPHCKQHENKKVDKKSVEFVCFVLNITKIPHKKKPCSLVFYGKAYKTIHTKNRCIHSSGLVMLFYNTVILKVPYSLVFSQKRVYEPDIASSQLFCSQFTMKVCV